MLIIIIICRQICGGVVWCSDGLLANEKGKVQQLIKKVFHIPYGLAEINSCLLDSKN